MTYRDLNGTQSDSFYLGGEVSTGIKISGGKLQGKDGVYDWEDVLGKSPFYINTDTKEPTGFVNRTDSVISFNNSTRTFTIQPVSSSYDIYYCGVRITKTTANSCIIDNISGLWYFYFDASGVLNTSQSNSNFIDFIPISIVHWCAMDNKSHLMEERHGIIMDCDTHKNLHNSVGTSSYGGFDLDGYTFDTDSDTAVTISVSEGDISDEDIRIQIRHSNTPTNFFEQILNDPAQLPVYYRMGSGDWHWDTASNFFFKNTTSGNVNYNYYNGSAWVQQQCNNNYYVAYWIFATNKTCEPIISIQGQREDNSLSNAVNNNKYEQLDYGELITSEMKILYRIIVQTGNSFGGTRKAKISHIEDLRGNTYQRPDIYKPLYHCALQGKDTWAHPLTSLYINDTEYSNFLGNLGGKNDVLLSDILEEIDKNTSDFRIHLANVVKTGGCSNSFFNGCFSWEDDFIINIIGKTFSQDGYFRISMPTVNTQINRNGGGTISVTSNGIPLSVGDVLFYKLPYGTDYTTKHTNFFIANSNDESIDLDKDYVPIVIRTLDDIIDIPGKSRIYVCCSASNSTRRNLIKNVWNKVILDVVHSDNCNSINNSRFIAPRDGVMLINTNYIFSFDNESRRQLGIAVYKNNSRYINNMIDVHSINKKIEHVLTYPMMLEKNDYLEFYVFPDSDCNIEPNNVSLKIVSLDH